jgi:hypothetical protein
MKRSKIFLSVATCVLAIAAFAATKARALHTVCYTTGTSHINHSASKLCSSTEGSHLLCTISGVKYYTSLLCTHRAYTAS